MTAHEPRHLLNIEDFINRTLALQSAEELLRFFTTQMEDLGFEYVALFLLADRHQYTKKVEDGLFFHTFPMEWTDLYREHGHLSRDPMVEFSKIAPKPFRWMLGQSEGQPPLTSEQKTVVDDMRQFGFTDGITVPIFLHSGRIIHCALATKKGRVDISEGEMIEIGYLCHHVYNRYRELARNENLGMEIRLSQRESDVLQWAAAGKSNPVIAEILGISPHTVDTLMRRCFRKLGVSNRTSAVLKAVATGLIAP